VRAEFCLTALVYNLRRARSILGVETTMPAVPRGKRLKCGSILAGTTHVGSLQVTIGDTRDRNEQTAPFVSGRHLETFT